MGKQYQAPKKRRQTVSCHCCGKNIKYGDVLMKAVCVYDEQHIIHSRCQKDGSQVRPLTKKQQKYVKINSKFVKCKFCGIMLDVDNGRVHIIKCVKQEAQNIK